MVGCQPASSPASSGQLSCLPWLREGTPSRIALLSEDRVLPVKTEPCTGMPAWSAYSQAIIPLASFKSDKLLPALDESNTNTSWKPLRAARCNADWPSSLRAAISARRSNRNWHKPADGTEKSGVCPRLSRALTSALALSNALTMSVLPLRAARCNGCLPLASQVWTLARACNKSVAKICELACTALMRGVSGPDQESTTTLSEVKCLWIDLQARCCLSPLVVSSSACLDS
mmetsp:Transcript_108937/g.170268  ORF Transcript_108937/g.170268 Transcript_108937/m.170268 type:complete len:231 (+) Transcript_108937:219-911(+)